MRTGWGVASICVGLALGLVTAVVLRTRMPRLAVVGLLAASGAVVGVGALLVQTRVSVTEWVVTLVVLSAMVPFQARLVFGRLGKTADPASGTVVPD